MLATGSIVDNEYDRRDLKKRNLLVILANDADDAEKRMRFVFADDSDGCSSCAVRWALRLIVLPMKFTNGNFFYGFSILSKH